MSYRETRGRNQGEGVTKRVDYLSTGMVDWGLANSRHHKGTAMTIATQTLTPDQQDQITALIASSPVYLRPNEVFIKVQQDQSAGHRCYSASCGHAPLVQVRTCWDHRITDDYSRGGPGTWKLGEDPFDTWRHADGSQCGDNGHNCFTQPRCGNCGSYGTLVTKQHAWHDEITCTECENVKTYQIGD